MATRRKRDHAAEYAAAKRRAQAAGYRGTTEYRRAKKRLGVKGRVSPVPKRVAELIVDAGRDRDNDSRAWSRRHSQRDESAWSESLSEPLREAYYRAFVRRSRRTAKWRKSFHDWLVPQFYTEEEYVALYGGGVAIYAA